MSSRNGNREGVGVSSLLATLVLGVFAVSAVVTVALGLYLFGII